MNNVLKLITLLVLFSLAGCALSVKQMYLPPTEGPIADVTFSSSKLVDIYDIEETCAGKPKWTLIADLSNSGKYKVQTNVRADQQSVYMFKHAYQDVHVSTYCSVPAVFNFKSGKKYSVKFVTTDKRCSVKALEIQEDGWPKPFKEATAKSICNKAGT